jgi:branched-chain amino acid transport system permease protein
VLGSHYSDIFAFIVLIIMLTLRPRACLASVWQTAPEGAPDAKKQTLRFPGRGGGLLILPLLLQTAGNAWVRIADMALLYVLLALGLNIVVGYAGLLDLGFVAFFAIGAYMFGLMASPHLTESFPWFAQMFPNGLHTPLWIVIPLAALLAGILGILLGAPTLKLRGDYLAIVTLGFGEIIRVFLNNLDHPVNITNGPKGLGQIDSITFFGLDLGKKLNIGGFELASVTLYYYLFLCWWSSAW